MTATYVLPRGSVVLPTLALGFGVVIPHSDIAGVDDLAAGVAPVDLEAGDDGLLLAVTADAG